MFLFFYPGRCFYCIFSNKGRGENQEQMQEPTPPFICQVPRWENIFFLFRKEKSTEVRQIGVKGEYGTQS